MDRRADFVEQQLAHGVEVIAAFAEGGGALNQDLLAPEAPKDLLAWERGTSPSFQEKVRMHGNGVEPPDQREIVLEDDRFIGTPVVNGQADRPAQPVRSSLRLGAAPSRRARWHDS